MYNCHRRASYDHVHNLHEKCSGLRRVVLIDVWFFWWFLWENKNRKIGNRKLRGGIATKLEVKCTKRRRIKKGISWDILGII
jgi:hypothetical protein